MKPAREAFILDQQGGAEIKSYALAGQAVLLAAIVPLYGSLASRLPRRRLINLVTAFFIACLPVFYAVSQAGMTVGVPFFLWIGIFSLMVIAQFWAYANDIHTPEEGSGCSRSSPSRLERRRVRRVAVRAVDRGVRRASLLLVAAVILAASLAVFNYIDLRRRAAHAAQPGRTGEDVDIGDGNAFALVLRSRYLLLVAGTIFLLNWCNSAGEYILSPSSRTRPTRRSRPARWRRRTRDASSAASTPTTSRL